LRECVKRLRPAIAGSIALGRKNRDLIKSFSLKTSNKRYSVLQTVITKIDQAFGVLPSFLNLNPHKIICQNRFAFKYLLAFF